MRRSPGSRWGRCGASGRAGRQWLEDQGITTALDLKRADPKAIRRKMTVVGERLVHELNGRSCLPLELVDTAAARPHGVALVRADVDRAPAHQGRAGRLRRPGRGEAPAPGLDGGAGPWCSSRPTGSRRRQPFYANSATVRLPYPTDFTPDLVEAAVQLLERLYRPGFHYQKCGVMLLDLSPATQAQADLFDTRDRAPRGLADAGARLPQYRLRRAHRAGRQCRRDTPGLGDAAGVSQPALYDAVAGVAGGAVVGSRRTTRPRGTASLI